MRRDGEECVMISKTCTVQTDILRAGKSTERHIDKHGRKTHTRFWREHLAAEDRLEYVGTDGGNNTDVKQTGCKHVDWINLAQTVTNSGMS